MASSHQTRRLGLSQPAVYQIKVQGRLSARWAHTFDGLALGTDDGGGITTLSGFVADQAALHGLLAQIRDLGLPLLSVVCTETVKERDVYLVTDK